MTLSITSEPDIMRRHRPLVPTLFIVVAAFSLVATGCGGGASPGVASVTSSTVSSAAAATDRANALHLAGQCIRQNGIPNFEDPTAGFFDKPALKAVPLSVANQALEACRTALERAGIRLSGPNSQVITQQRVEELLALARCIRSHGVPNFPDPNPTTGDFGRPPGVSFPQLLAAARECRPLVKAAGLGMPTPGNASGSGT